MHLYNFTIQPSNATPHAVVGNFSGGRQQEVLVSRGTRLELLQVNPNTGKMIAIVASDIFGSIRALATFRLTGMTKDHIVVGSDSGRIVILAYDATSNSFVKVHQETYGKSGARRIVPGQYLAVDPKGRAIMMAAMEKAKLVYILNRDDTANLTISSPLDAHQISTIIHHIVGLDVGFEHPTFAALEVNYTESDRDPTGTAFESTEKMLTYYELDLGLNHVVRRWSKPTDLRANMLVQVPGSDASTSRFGGPSGVLVCCEDHLIYEHKDFASHRVPIPHRNFPFGEKERGLLIVAAIMHKMKDDFFFLLQSEEGDLYKVTIEHNELDVTALKIKYFDTVPVASSLCILKSGFLVVASEFGDQHIYQFLKLGEEDKEREYSSTDYVASGMADPCTALPRVFFSPRPLHNLSLVDEVQSLNPIIESKVLKILPNAEAPQIFAACGRGSRSTFRALRHGLDVQAATVKHINGVANAVWATKLKANDVHDAFVVLSLANETLVLATGDHITEVHDTGFIESVPTIAVQQIGVNAILQVHLRGIRHILADKRVHEWRAPDDQMIVKATANNQQAVVALSNGELIYFELDLDEQLNEYQDRRALGSTVLAMSIGELPTGRQRTPFLAVGCEDQTVRIISLDPKNTLDTISLQALSAPPSSVCIVEMLDMSVDKTQPTMFVNIGLQNGVLLRTVLDPVNGQLIDTRTRFLGTKAVELARVTIQGKPAVIAMSSRPWLNYTYENMMHLTPLLCDPFDRVASLAAELLPDGLIAISGTTIRIIGILELGNKLKQVIIPLDYTPRKFAAHPQNELFYVIESDHRTYSTDAIQQHLDEMRTDHSNIDDEILNLPSKEFGRPKAPAGVWASCIRIIDATAGQTVQVIYLDDNEAAFSLAIVPFAACDDNLHLVIGTAQGVILTPKSCTSGFLRTYKFTSDGRDLELLHKTELEDIPLALSTFQGRLAVGVGKHLRLYDMGKMRLLRKAENKDFPSAIVTLNTQGNRILVGDMQESISYVTYNSAENRLLVIADDTQSRWVTSSTMLDYNTVVAGDRFGNIFVNRLDSKVSDQVDSDPTGAGFLNEKGVLMGAPHKTTMLAHFHVGDIVTGIHKVRMVVGGREVLLYTGLHGTIGILAPFESRDDVEFMSTLEQHMRSEQLSLIGRDHLAWRGSYVPVKAVVDGDLCEMFACLLPNKQSEIANKLERSVGEILKKLEQLRIAASGI